LVNDGWVLALQNCNRSLQIVLEEQDTIIYYYSMIKTVHGRGIRSY
jgi:hypothetical protein